MFYSQEYLHVILDQVYYKNLLTFYEGRLVWASHRSARFMQVHEPPAELTYQSVGSTRDELRRVQKNKNKNVSVRAGRGDLGMRGMAGAQRCDSMIYEAAGLRVSGCPYGQSAPSTAALD